MEYQKRAWAWCVEAFGTGLTCDRLERVHRFLEEALELSQALGCNRREAAELVDYVFNRDKGEPGQEVGGTMLTLAILCQHSGIAMDVEAERELARVNTPEVLAKCRAKNATKPRNSALPGTADDTARIHGLTDLSVSTEEG